jgi:RNA-directed DNA polymerase
MSDEATKDQSARALQGWPPFSSTLELAHALELDRESFSRLAYGGLLHGLDHYRHFSIPKRRGGVRQISAPSDDLRRVQRWISRNILIYVPVHESATAYRVGVSTVDNARIHARRGLEVRVDIRDFFPSITFRRVQTVFSGLDYPREVSLSLAALTTTGARSSATWHLPQGACTSPTLSNIACFAMDQALVADANSQGYVYTRYADDLVFSHLNSEANVDRLLTSVRSIANEDGFQLNESKTRVMRDYRRQIVTGLVVNSEPRVSRRDIRRFRAFLHQCQTKGVDKVSHELGKNALNYAKGYLAYVHMVNPEQAQKLLATNPWLTSKSACKGDTS